MVEDFASKCDAKSSATGHARDMHRVRGHTARGEELAVLRGLGAIVLGALLLVGCAAVGGALGVGLGPPAEVPVAEADRVEVRRVLISGTEAPESGDPQPSPFGELSLHVGWLEPSEVSDLIPDVSQARFIDTGTTVYDLVNPRLEVVFFEGETELARLGYYDEINSWGDFEVPGRWLDADWTLLALTTVLPERLVAAPES